MFPLVAWGAIGLGLFIRLLEPSRPIDTVSQALPAVDVVRAIAGTLCFALVVLEIFRLVPAWPAAMLAAVAVLALLTHRYRDMDLSIVPLFFFAFIVVEDCARSTRMPCSRVSSASGRVSASSSRRPLRHR